jgi:hypothetical protein
MAATNEGAGVLGWMMEADIAPTNCKWKGSVDGGGASRDSVRSSTSHQSDR